MATRQQSLRGGSVGGMKNQHKQNLLWIVVIAPPEVSSWHPFWITKPPCSCVFCAGWLPSPFGLALNMHFVSQQGAECQHNLSLLVVGTVDSGDKGKGFEVMGKGGMFNHVEAKKGKGDRHLESARVSGSCNVFVGQAHGDWVKDGCSSNVLFPLRAPALEKDLGEADMLCVALALVGVVDWSSSGGFGTTVMPTFTLTCPCTVLHTLNQMCASPVSRSSQQHELPWTSSLLHSKFIMRCRTWLT